MADLWKKSKSPNYQNNKDKMYPYSELPVLSGFQLVKIPFCVKNLIEHVDYFGLGRINLTTGTTGFPDCYNVNYEYRLVDVGPDKDRRIPNRIPISEVLRSSNVGFSTRNYIKDNSVLTVTVNLETEVVTDMIAQDIARIVNSERGKVIVYGYDMNAFERLCDELRKMKQLLYCPIYLLPNKLRLTYWKTCYRAYLGVKELKRELYLNVYKSDFEAAVILTGCLTDTHCGGALGDVVNKLLQNKVGNVIAYAYKLWNNNYKEVVLEHFPSVFQHIFDGDCMAIINKLNNQALILEPKTTKAQGDGNYTSSKKLVWKIITYAYKLWNNNYKEVVLEHFPSVHIFDGDCMATINKLNNQALILEPKTTKSQRDSNYKSSKKLGYKMIPIWHDNNVFFKLYNIESDESEKLFVSPLIMENGQVAFDILNCEENKKLLELPVDVDSSEVKAVVVQKSVECEDEQNYYECEDEQNDESENEYDYNYY